MPQQVKAQQVQTGIERANARPKLVDRVQGSGRKRAIPARRYDSFRTQYDYMPVPSGV